MYKRVLIILISGLFVNVALAGEVESRIIERTVNFKGETLRLKIDSLCKTPRLIFGFNKSIASYGLDYTSATKEKIVIAARKFLNDYAEILNIDPKDLELKMARKTGGNWVVSFSQILLMLEQGQ